MLVCSDRDRLYEASDEMIRIDMELENLQYAIEQLVYSTCTDWQGAAEKAFAEKIIIINEKYNTLHSFVKEFSRLLKDFADSYEALDEDIANKIKLI